jgi:hypothetical protein
MKTRKEITARQKAKYEKSTKKEKGLIIDNICLSTGLSRSRVKHIMTSSDKISAKQKPRGRIPKYDKLTIEALEKIWTYMDFPCGRRLVAGMDTMIDALVRFDEIDFEKEVLVKLNEISPATADRYLKHVKDKLRFKGVSTTNPGTLLKRDIPLRLGTEWDDAIPGYVEIDLVAHCGTTTAGEYVNTLNVTDICTGWTETRAVINKAQKHVFNALLNIQKKQPFPFLGIDSDNGSEFINHQLYRYCKENSICFTRSRPYQKNDNCHVEQKNWTVVRRNIGYGRYEGQQAVTLMNQYYDLFRLYSNFFLPQTKLISKSRDGTRIRKLYDSPKTPLQRVLDSEYIPEYQKSALIEMLHSLNPIALKRDMAALLDMLFYMLIPS